MTKQEILARIDFIQSYYCQDCFLHRQMKKDSGRRHAHRFCISQCTVGEKIKEIGSKLNNKN